MGKLFFGLAMLLCSLGYVQAEQLVKIGPPKILTPEEQEAVRKRNEERRRAEEAEKARVEAEKRSLGLGSHRDQEAEKFLEMKRRAEAGRSGQFGAGQSTAQNDASASSRGEGQADGQKCEMHPVRQHGRGDAESEAEARQKAEQASRCLGAYGGVQRVEKSECSISDDGYRLVWDKQKNRARKEKTQPVKYHCYRAVQCVKQVEKCTGGKPAKATRQ